MTLTLKALTALRDHGYTPKQSGKSWTCRCPAHEDRNPSLSISTGDDGRVLMMCHAGCAIEAICSEIDLTLRDLMPDNGTAPRRTTPRRRGDGDTTPRHTTAKGGSVTVASVTASESAFSTAREAVAALERGLGKRSAEWVYHNAAGEPVGLVIRWNTPKGKDIRPVSRLEDGSGWTIGAMPEPRSLYGLVELRAMPNARVLIVEGEKTAEAALACGFLATTNAGGSNAPHKTDWSPLAGRDVVIFPDHDEPSEKWAAAVVDLAFKAGAQSVRMVRLTDRWPDLPKGGDLADVLELEGGDGASVRVEVKALIDAAEPEATADGEPPLVFDIAAMFPPNAAFAHHYFADIARSTQTPIEMPALLGLAIASACVANVAQVRGHGDHIEPAQIWALVLSEPGTRKSSVLTELLRPIIAWESQQAKELGPVIAAAEQRHRITQQRIKHLEGEAAKAIDQSKRAQCEREAVELVQELEADPVPTPPVLLACEPTPEALTRQMAANDGRALLASAEGDALDIVQGRYSGSRNYGTMLKGHAGDTIRAQRVGRTGETIDRPALAVALCIQRAAVEAMWADPQAEGRGLLARFAVIAPPDLVGSREIRPAPIDNAIRVEWCEAIGRMLGFKPEDEPVMIGLSADADRIYHPFQVRIESALGFGELADRRAWGSKLCGLVLRMALTLHALSKWAYSGTPAESGLIDGPTMAAAIVWADYLMAAERAARGLINEDDRTRDRRKLKSWIISRGGSASVKELQDGMRRKYPTAIDATTALDGLANSDGAHWEHPPPGPKGGRPSKRLVLDDKQDTAKRKTPPSTPDNAGSAFCDSDANGWAAV